MARFEWKIEFEAENAAEAYDLIYNESYGAIESFGDIHEERLKEVTQGDA